MTTLAIYYWNVKLVDRNGKARTFSAYALDRAAAIIVARGKMPAEDFSHVERAERLFA